MGQPYGETPETASGQNGYSMNRLVPSPAWSRLRPSSTCQQNLTANRDLMLRCERRCCVVTSRRASREAQDEGPRLLGQDQESGLAGGSLFLWALSPSWYLC